MLYVDTKSHRPENTEPNTVHLLGSLLKLLKGGPNQLPVDLLLKYRNFLRLAETTAVFTPENRASVPSDTVAARVIWRSQSTVFDVTRELSLMYSHRWSRITPSSCLSSTRVRSKATPPVHDFTVYGYIFL